MDANAILHEVRKLLPIYLTNFFLAAAIGVIFVVLDDVQRMYGISDFGLGLIAACGFGTTLITNLALAPQADRGARLPLALTALTCGFIAPVLFAYGSNVTVLALSRGLAGVGLGIFALLARKAVLGLGTGENGKHLGILISTTVAGFVSGPIIGAAFEGFGFPTPFLFTAAAIFAFGVPATLTLLRLPLATAKVDYSDAVELLRNTRVRSSMIMMTVVYGYIGMFDATVDKFLTDLGASTEDTAKVILVVGLPLFVLPRFAGQLAEKHGPVPLMIPALVVLFPAILGYGIVTTVSAVMLCGLCHGAAEAYISLSAEVQALNEAGTERAATVSALLGTAGLSAAMIGAVASPVLYGRYGALELFFVAALIGACVSVVGVKLALSDTTRAATKLPSKAKHSIGVSG